jgi:GH43 family beta-xylosidase
MFNRKNCLALLVVTVALSCRLIGQTFTNPLLPSGPDPYSFYKDGYYYYTSTLGNRIGIWKTKSLANLPAAQFKVIYSPPPGTACSKELWAPEILFLQGKWYAYFAADDGSNAHHRLYVIELEGNNPMTGNWRMKGKLSDSTDKWAIDGDVFSFRNQLYLVWSGWLGNENGEQDIFIAKMSNPWTVGSKRVCISRPSFAWEKIGDLVNQSPSHINVNEGPQALLHGRYLFIIYSASACWTDSYALGQLRFNGKENLLDSANWTKSPLPVFSQSPEQGVYATGHNSFFTSPNGKENWILYHANSNPGDGCGNKRSPRAQPFTWNKDGTPHFGQPVKAGTPLRLPAE